LKYTLGAHEFTSIYLKQVGATTIIKGLSVLISIFYIPIVLGFLETEKYGIWITLSTIVNWVRLLDIGIGNGMRNKLSESIATSKLEQGRIYISTTYAFLGIIFLTFLIVFHVINPNINWADLLNTNSLSKSELLKLTSIAVTFIILSFIFQPVTLIYASHGDTATGGVVQLIISSLTLFLIWAATLFAEKGDLIVMAWIVTGIPVVVYILFTIYTFRVKYRSLCPSLEFVKFRESGSLIKLSGQFFVVQITAAILFASVPFVITQLFSPDEVAKFHVASSIYNLAPMLMSIITAPGHSLITQSFARGDYDWTKKLLKNQVLISIALVCFTIVIILTSPIIYRLWLGDKISISWGLSIAVGIYSIISVLNAPFSTFINAIGRIKILIIIAPISIISFIGLSIILSNVFNNVIVISIALSLTSMIGLILIPWKINKVLKESLRKR